MRTTTMSIVTGAVLALSAASASAQTGPFAGPYLGVQGGVSANELDFTGTFTDPLGTDTLETEFGATGVVGGVYGGFGGSFDSVAVGLEGDFSWNGAENESTTTTTVPGGIGTSITSEFQESYGVSALVGMAPSPTAMPNSTIYLRGGWQWQAVEFEASDTAAGTTFEAEETFDGPVAGIGIAVGLTPNVAARLDYRHVFYGEEETSAETVAGATETESFSIDEDRVMLGIHWQFGEIF